MVWHFARNPYLCIRKTLMTMDKNIVIYNFMDTFFCCEVKNEKYCEEMVTEHMLVYLCSGEMDLIEPSGRQHHLRKGDSFFVPRNHKMRKVKHPAKNGEPFKGLFLQQKEAVLTLLQLRPDLAPVLFDCAEPWKVDLREFMDKNYASDLDLQGFAHYTGRSLSTFKKDFEQQFRMSPMKWIVRRRLDEARHLIEQQGEKPLDVYLRVGFKNLSHFSTAYKREFGYPPSVVGS